MKNTYLVTVAVFTALISLGLRAQSSTPISLKIALVGDSPKIGSEVRLKVTLTNVTQHPIRVATNWAEQLYKVDLRDSSGNPVPKKEHFSFGSLSNIDLAPGESHEANLELSHMYELTRAGTYIVQLVRKPGHEPGLGTEHAKSNVLVINIAPKEGTADNLH